HARPANRLAMRQEAMNPCYPDVIESRYLIPHQLSGYHRFFRNRNIAGSSGDNRDQALAVHCFVLLKDNGTSFFLVRGLLDLLLDGKKLAAACAGCQHVTGMLCQLLENLSNLDRSLPLTEDHLG